jgi:hypothetical protein
MDNCEHLTVGVARRVDEVLRPARRRCVGHQPRTARLEGVTDLEAPPLVADDSAVRLFCDQAGLTGDLDSSVRATVVRSAGSSMAFPRHQLPPRRDVLTPAEILRRMGATEGYYAATIRR